MIKGANPANIAKVLDIVELSARKDDKYRTYSLGMKQRLAIASALVSDPIILILDEPTNGLDPMGIAEIREIVKRIAADGKTIILASHLLDEVQKVCTHFAVLRRGKLMHSGPVDEVGKGEETVEVMAYHDDLSILLQEFVGSATIKKENGIFQVMMKDGFHSQDLNKFLFEKGSILGLNTEILCDYVDWLYVKRLKAIGITPDIKVGSHPLPWLEKHFGSGSTQVAPQEVELSSYLSSSITNDMGNIDLSDMFGDL
jgi:ABC-type multidrug transport system ATPase subunit